VRHVPDAPQRTEQSLLAERCAAIGSLQCASATVGAGGSRRFGARLDHGRNGSRAGSFSAIVAAVWVAAAG